MRYTLTFDGVPVGVPTCSARPRAAGPLFVLPAFERCGLRRVRASTQWSVRFQEPDPPSRVFTDQ